jgi:hypothetical protein
MINIGVAVTATGARISCANFAEIEGRECGCRGRSRHEASSNWCSGGSPPRSRTTTRFQDLIADPSIDAIAIATPVSTHFELGMAALQGRQAPVAREADGRDSLQARKLVDEAEKRGLVLLVDHTFIYTGAVAEDGRDRRIRRPRPHLLLRLGAREPRPVPARRQRDLGPRGARLLDPRLPARRAPGRGLGERHQPLPGHAREPRVHHAVLRLGPIAHANVSWLAPSRCARSCSAAARR